jgi:hypothetical protein
MQLNMQKHRQITRFLLITHENWIWIMIWFLIPRSKEHSLDPIQNHFNLDLTLMSCFFEIILILFFKSFFTISSDPMMSCLGAAPWCLLLPRVSRSPNWYILFTFFIWNLGGLYSSHLPMYATCPVHLILFDLKTIISLVNISKVHNTYFFHPPAICTFWR